VLARVFEVAETEYLVLVAFLYATLPDQGCLASFVIDMGRDGMRK
jgi:hypothetical protein